MVMQDSALVAAQNPMGVMLDAPKNDEITLYTVQPGDVPGKIAQKFGISLNTLLWANNIRDAGKIKPGSTLVILPVTGVRYTVAKGDTIEKIAKRFSGEVSDILEFNNLAVGDTLAVGTTLIIPDGELPLTIAARPKVSPKTNAPLIGGGSGGAAKTTIGYYIRPIVGGVKTQGIHGANAVDMAISCGSPLYASAKGTVIIAKTGGYNGGYGNYAVIAHPNGTQTLYGHMSAVSVGLGQLIGQGDVIGAVGESGHATGCHVHFEIRGGIRNPF